MKPGDLVVAVDPEPDGYYEMGRVYRITKILGLLIHIEDPTGEIPMRANGYFDYRFKLVRSA